MLCPEGLCTVQFVDMHIKIIGDMLIKFHAKGAGYICQAQLCTLSNLSGLCAIQLMSSTCCARSCRLTLLKSLTVSGPQQPSFPSQTSQAGPPRGAPFFSRPAGPGNPIGAPPMSGPPSASGVSNPRNSQPSGQFGAPQFGPPQSGLGTFILLFLTAIACENLHCAVQLHCSTSFHIHAPPRAF